MLINDLPDDVLCAVFITPILECILDRSVYTNPQVLREHMNNIHRITHISSRIRSTAISTSQLWSVWNDCTLYRGDEGSTWMERSGNTGLTIVLDKDPHFTEWYTSSIVEQVLCCRERWKVLHVRAQTRTYDYFSDQLFRRPGPSPASLEHLEVHRKPAMFSIPLDLPRLRSMVFVHPNLGHSIFRPSNSFKLASVTLGCIGVGRLPEVVVLHNFLEGQPQLEELVVDFLRSDLDASSEAIGMLRGIQFPVLRRLWFGCAGHNERVWEFSHLLSAPNVRTLLVGGSAHDSDVLETGLESALQHFLTAMPMVETFGLIQVKNVTGNIWSLIGEFSQLKNIVIQEAKSFDNPLLDGFPGLEGIHFTKCSIPKAWLDGLLVGLRKASCWGRFKAIHISPDSDVDGVVDQNKMMETMDRVYFIDQNENWMDHVLRALRWSDLYI